MSSARTIESSPILILTFLLGLPSSISTNSVSSVGFMLLDAALLAL